MQEIKNILSMFRSLDADEVKVALATVIKVRGSSYRSPGARMLMTDMGQWVGSISGGCLEGDALRQARKVIRDGVPALITYDTREESSGMALGLGCNGIIDVLLEPIHKEHKMNPIHMLQQFEKLSTPGAHALVYHASGVAGVCAGQHITISEDQKHSDLPVEVMEVLLERLENHLEKRQSQTERIHFEEGFVDVFLEVLEPPIRLLIFGGGFDVKPVTELASMLGWEIAVTEECIAHAVPANFPKAGIVAQCQTDQILTKFEITPYTAAIVMSHNFLYDKKVLKELLTAKPRYVGVLGPRSRFERIVAELSAEGQVIDAQFLERIHSPIGLDVGAETAEEIALSIIAEIKAVFSGREGQHLQKRNAPIHSRVNGTEEIYKQHSVT